MSGWEQILTLLLAGAIFLLFLPGAKRMLKESRTGEKKEWMNILFIAGIVVLFVLFLIISVR